MTQNTNNNKNIMFGKPKAIGGVYKAPLGTALPTDATTPLASTYKCMGYVSTEGVEATIENKKDPLKAWGSVIVKTVSKEFGASYKFTLIEALNTAAMESYYGKGAVKTTAPSGSVGTKHEITVKQTDSPIEVYVFEIFDGETTKRIVIPHGQVSEIGKIKYKDEEAITYELTVTALSDTDGVYVKEFIQCNDKTA